MKMNVKASKKIPSLEQEGITSESTIQERIKRLDSRNDLQSLQRAISPSRNMRNCSLQPVAMVATSEEARNTEIKVKINEFGYGFSGLATCDNPFCIFCSKGKAMKRAEKIKQVLVATKDSHSQFFTTFTIPRQNSPSAAATEIQNRWKKIQNRLTYIFRTSRKKQGLEPIEILFCKAVDITFTKKEGKRPYHIHLHCLILIEGEYPIEEMNHLIETWVHKQGIEIQANEKGQKIEPVFWGNRDDDNNLKKDGKLLAKYIAKMSGLGLEIANGNNKTGKQANSLSLVGLMEKSLKEWNLLSDFQKEEVLTFGYAGNDWITKTKAPHIILYQSFVNEMKGKRTISFSRSWKKYEDELDPYKDRVEPQNEGEITIPLTRWSIVQTSMIEIGRILYFSLGVAGDKSALEALEEILDLPERQSEIFFKNWIKTWRFLIDMGLDNFSSS